MSDDDMDEELTDEAEEAEFDDDDDFDGPAEDEVDESEIDDVDDLDIEEPIEEFSGDGGDDDDEDDEDDEQPETPRARKVTSEEEDEDDETDPDDVEADLEAILRDRMAAADEDEDEDGEDGGGTPGDSSSGPRNDEFVCDSCFLLVNRSQFGSARDPRCPMGDPECPSIVKIFG